VPIQKEYGASLIAGTVSRLHASSVHNDNSKHEKASMASAHSSAQSAQVRTHTALEVFTAEYRLLDNSEDADTAAVALRAVFARNSRTIGAMYTAYA
jgi:pyridoxine/pyridoxamine 5'-phosphate oxidase